MNFCSNYADIYCTPVYTTFEQVLVLIILPDKGYN